MFESASCKLYENSLLEKCGVANLSNVRYTRFRRRQEIKQWKEQRNAIKWNWKLMRAINYNHEGCSLCFRFLQRSTALLSFHDFHMNSNYGSRMTKTSKIHCMAEFIIIITDIFISFLQDILNKYVMLLTDLKVACKVDESKLCWEWKLGSTGNSTQTWLTTQFPLAGSSLEIKRKSVSPRSSLCCASTDRFSLNLWVECSSHRALSVVLDSAHEVNGPFSIRWLLEERELRESEMSPNFPLFCYCCCQDVVNVLHFYFMYEDWPCELMFSLCE